MKYPSCYPRMIELIPEATEKLGAAYTINPNKYAIIKPLCDQIDSFASDLDCIEIEVSADLETQQICVAIVCDEIILENGRSHVFFTLIQELSSFNFYHHSDGNLYIMMIIDGMWKKKKK